VLLDDEGELELLPEELPEPMLEPDDEDDVPMSLLPDERVPVVLHAASETAQASSTIHLFIAFSFWLITRNNASRPCVTMCVKIEGFG
jgi:hypothetical protein